MNRSSVAPSVHYRSVSFCLIRAWVKSILTMVIHTATFILQPTRKGFWNMKPDSYCSYTKLEPIRYHTIDDRISVYEYKNNKPEFYIAKEDRFGNVIHHYISNATEWCEENDIDPLDMTTEDKMAFKLRWS